MIAQNLDWVIRKMFIKIGKEYSFPILSRALWLLIDLELSTLPNQSTCTICKLYFYSSLFPIYTKFNAMLGSWLAVDSNVAEACCKSCCWM